MKLNYSKKILILAMLLFLVVFVSNIIFIYLLFGTINGVNDKVRQLNISSQKREEELLLKDMISDFRPEREKINQYFVGAGNADIVAFTKSLEDLADAYGVSQRKTLSHEPISELKNSETVSNLRFRFNVSGKWANVFNFFQSIETLPKVIKINSVVLSVNSSALSAKEVKTNEKTWMAEIDFSVVKLKI